jgi:transcriptional antiterminator RfaH
MQSLPRDRWVVVHAKPRCEKLLARDLAMLGIAGCLFLERRLRRYRGKGVQESLVPLLGGYLFVHRGREQNPSPIYRTERVVGIIGVADPGRLADDLDALRRLVEGAVRPLVVRPELQPGQVVTVQDGVFAGCRGVIVRRAGAGELVVNIEALGHSVAVTLDAGRVGEA